MSLWGNKNENMDEAYRNARLGVPIERGPNTGGQSSRGAEHTSAGTNKVSGQKSSATKGSTVHNVSSAAQTYDEGGEGYVIKTPEEGALLADYRTQNTAYDKEAAASIKHVGDSVTTYKEVNGEEYRVTYTGTSGGWGRIAVETHIEKVS